MQNRPSPVTYLPLESMAKKSKEKNQARSRSRSANATSSDHKWRGHEKSSEQPFSESRVSRPIVSSSVPLTDKQVMDQFLDQAPDMNESRHRCLEQVVWQLSNPLSSHKSRKIREGAQHPRGT